MANAKTQPLTADRTLTLKVDKVTKGAVRYSDGDGHTIYLRKEELRTEGKSQPHPEEIKLSLSFVWGA